MNDTTPKQAGLTVEQTQVVCRRLAAINYQLEAILTNGGQSPDRDRDLVTGHGEDYDRLVNMPRALSEAEILRMLGIAREGK